MANIEYIHFGRMRPMHINAVLFGFVTPGLLAVAFYYFPRLLRTELYSQKLGVLTAIFWNITVAAGMVGDLPGLHPGPGICRIALDRGYHGGHRLRFGGHQSAHDHRQRKEPILYVSIWYAMSAVILTACTYCLGNVIWKPDTGALVGIPDAILLWFYGHNIFGLLLTPHGTGCCLLCPAHRHPQPALQSHHVPGGVLVAHHCLHPCGHPSPAPGTRYPPG